MSRRPRAFFVTGTDTGVGKTLVSAALLIAARRRGLAVAAMKPAESGCPRDADDALFPEDAAALWRAAGEHQALTDVCPYRFEEPIAPGVAATHHGVEIDFSFLFNVFQEIRRGGADLVIVEGAGGLRVPFGGDATTADLVARFDVPLLVVARDGLGTINHTLLTVESARRSGLEVAGVILSASQPGGSMAFAQQNAAEIQRLGDVAILGILPHVTDISQTTLATAAEVGLDLDALGIVP
jgi:dethiobiotin synthetase